MYDYIKIWSKYFCFACILFASYTHYYFKNMTVTINDIKELNASHVHIRNELELAKKLNSLVNGGTENLQIVSDYDMTLTKQHENGKQHITSFGMIHKCKSIPSDYYEKEQKLYKKYRPIEIDPHMDKQEKLKHMQDWWRESENILKGIKLPAHEFDEVARIFNPALRDGTKQMMLDLFIKSVPVLVFSAGLGESVEAVLKHNKVLYPNVKVISNYLEYDKDDRIVGYKDAMITVLNKNEQILEGTEYYDLVKTRGNVILMGDHLGDSGMADGVPHQQTVLKIGFLYDHVEESLEAYKDAFDIVLVDDQTMDVIRSILNLIFKK